MTPIWLLEVDLGGPIVRVATEPVEVVDAAGVTRVFPSGLETPDTSGEDVSVAFFSTTDWASLRARGDWVERSRAVLRCWYAGQAWEQAEVVADGELTDTEYGSRAEPLIGTIVRPMPVAEATIPDLAAEINSDTWPVTDGYYGPDFEGTSYPVPIGYPGERGTSTGRPGIASPAYLVQSNWVDADGYLSAGRLLIADDEIHASTVTAHDLSDGIAQSRVVVTGPDRADRDVSYCGFTSKAEERALLPNPEHEFAVSYSMGGGGGVWNEKRTGPMRELGDVLLWAIRKQRRYRIDEGAQRAEFPYLRGFYVDHVITERVDVLEWVDRVLASVFPIERVDAGNGMYYAARRALLGVVDVEYTLDVDIGRARRIGGIRTRSPRKIANDITLKYGASVTGGYHGVARICGDRAYVANLPVGRNVLDARLEGSRGWLGDRAEVVETDAIWDDATAVLALRALARDRQPAEVVAYEGGPELQTARRGQGVLINDAEVGLYGRYGWIDEAPVVGVGVVSVMVRLESEPLAFARRTA